MNRINLIGQLSGPNLNDRDPIKYTYWKNYTTDDTEYWSSKVDNNPMRDSVISTMVWARENKQTFLLELIYEEGL